MVDSVDELRRVHETKADAKLYLRIATPNIGADWPLSGKFGAGAGDAREIVAAAAKLGADLAGVTFHVGSRAATRKTGASRWKRRARSSTSWPRPASRRACSTSVAAIRCATSSPFRRSR